MQIQGREVKLDSKKNKKQRKISTVCRFEYSIYVIQRLR